MGFTAKFVLYGLEKIRQAMTWGIKMFKTNFYLGVATEDGVGIGIYNSAQSAEGECPGTAWGQWKHHFRPYKVCCHAAWLTTDGEKVFASM